MTSIALQLKFMYVTSFLLLGQLRDLLTQKITSEFTHGTLIFYEYLLVNSVHLNSANLICPNS